VEFEADFVIVLTGTTAVSDHIDSSWTDDGRP